MKSDSSIVDPLETSIGNQRERLLDGIRNVG